MPRTFQTIPRLFPGKTVLCVGGGPSLRNIDLTRVNHLPTIAINNAAYLAPWAKVIFFGDRRWWRWQKEAGRLEELTSRGALIMTAALSVEVDPTVMRLNKVYDKPLSYDPQSVSGIDSGTMAINAAFHLGAKRIVLAGYDMAFAPDGTSHWHEPHKVPSIEKHYTDTFLPKFPALLAELRTNGVEVVSLTPTPIDVPVIDMEELL